MTALNECKSSHVGRVFGAWEVVKAWRNAKGQVYYDCLCQRCGQVRRRSCSAIIGKQRANMCRECWRKKRREIASHKAHKRRGVVLGGSLLIGRKYVDGVLRGMWFCIPCNREYVGQYPLLRTIREGRAPRCVWCKRRNPWDRPSVRDLIKAGAKTTVRIMTPEEREMHPVYRRLVEERRKNLQKARRRHGLDEPES